MKIYFINGQVELFRKISLAIKPLLMTGTKRLISTILEILGLGKCQIVVRKANYQFIFTGYIKDVNGSFHTSSLETDNVTLYGTCVLFR